MTRIVSLTPCFCGVLLLAGACSPDPRPANEMAAADNAGHIATNAVETSDLGTAAASPGAPAATIPIAAAPGAHAGTNVLTVGGLDDLRIGEPVPRGGSWAERGGQTSDHCRTVSSPDHPGAYAIVIDGRVQRITLGQRSGIRLEGGAGVGAREADITMSFVGLREDPHEYEDAPAKYLTAPDARSGASALRFEIGRDGKVKMIHVGLMPALGYVEGCA
ncbi:MAG: hypothetical protein AB7E60_09145 [Sphingobium sp.]